MEKFNWGVVGTGDIAEQFANQFEQKDSHLYGVCARDFEKTKKFAAKHNMPLREHLYSLNSYHIDWIRVEKESFRDFLKNMPT